MNIVTALDAEQGVTCMVGAGGKKTTLYHLANALPDAIVTATVRIPIFDSHVEQVLVTDEPMETITDVSDRPLGLVPEQEGNRYRGYEPGVITELAATVDDAILVKADGARTRWFKAPNESEPQIPRGADTIIPIVSAKIVGEPLTDEHVHRPERVAAITELSPGDEITAHEVASVLTSQAGGLKGIPPAATVIPLVNMADTPGLVETAHDIAERSLDSPSIARVVLAKMIADDPLVAVVE